MVGSMIDAHTHVFPDEIVKNPEEYFSLDSEFQLLYENSNAVIGNGEQLIRSMENSEINRSIACGFGWASNDLCVMGNNAIIRLSNEQPDKIIGFGTVSFIQSFESGLDEINRLSKAGIRGIGEIRAERQGFFDITENEFRVLAETLIENRMILLLHVSEPVGHKYPGKEGAKLELIESLLVKLKEVNVVLAHGGGGLPFYSYMPEVRGYLDNVWFDTAALPYLYKPAVLEAIISAVGSDRILFGSDFPLMSQEKVISYIQEADIKPDDKKRIFFDNLNHLLETNKSVD